MPSLRTRGFTHYRWQTGMAAWMLHRITGLGLVFYIILHIWVVSTLQLPAKEVENPGMMDSGAAMTQESSAMNHDDMVITDGKMQAAPEGEQAGRIIPFNEAMKFVEAPFFRFLEVGLLFCVIFHALNGIRLIAIDFFGATEKHVPIFYGLLVLGLILWVLGGGTMVNHAIMQLHGGEPFFPF